MGNNYCIYKRYLSLLKKYYCIIVFKDLILDVVCSVITKLITDFWKNNLLFLNCFNGRLLKRFTSLNTKMAFYCASMNENVLNFIYNVFFIIIIIPNNLFISFILGCTNFKNIRFCYSYSDGIYDSIIIYKRKMYVGENVNT